NVASTARIGSAPAQARPAIVERLAEINSRGTEKDHGGLAFNSRTLSENVERPEAVWTASGDGFGLVADEFDGRPAIVRRLAEINARGTEKDHGGLSFNSRTLR
ncbi:MAG: hypothetical protein AAFY57_15375, partial [Cyanobacteria bacterium J06642_2]